MASTFETRTTFDDFLKYEYAPTVQQTTKEHSALLKRLDTITARTGFGGKSIVIPINYDYMGSVSFTDSESDPLPISTPGNYDNASIGIYHAYFGIAVSGALIRSSGDAMGAWVTAVTQQTNDKMRSFNQHLDRVFCMDGNGILCQIDGSPTEVSANSIYTTYVDNAGGISGMASSAVNGDTFLTRNMYVNARNSSGTNHGVAKIYENSTTSAAVTPGAFPTTSAKITLIGDASSFADGDYLYCSTGTTALDAYGHESPGVRLLIDDGTLASTVQSISSTSYPEWRSHVGYGSTHGTAEALTAARLMRLYTAIVTDGGSVDFHATSPSVWLEYGKLADASNNVVNATSYDTAYPTLSFMGKELFMDPYMTDEWYMIDNRALKIYQTGPAGWLDLGNGVFKQRYGTSGGYDQMEAFWYWDVSMGIQNRKWCGKMVDISVSDGFYLNE